MGQSPAEIARTVFELLLVMLFFDRLIPQVLFTKTAGEWIAKISFLIHVLFYLVLPVTLTIGLLLSIAGLAEPEDAEAGASERRRWMRCWRRAKKKAFSKKSDRELVRSVVEFGDKVVREVMTPRPEMFAVPETMTLEEFTAEVNEHEFSRVPVYDASLDQVTGIAFARDLLGVKDADAASTGRWRSCSGRRCLCRRRRR